MSYIDLLGVGAELFDRKEANQDILTEKNK